MDFSLIFIILGILLAVGAITAVVITQRKKKKDAKAEEARLKQEAEDAEDERIAQEALDRYTGYASNGVIYEDEVAKDSESLTRKQAAARLKHPTYYRREDLAHKHNKPGLYVDSQDIVRANGLNDFVAAAIIADAISDNQVIEEQKSDIEDLQAEVDSLKDEVPSFEEEVSPEPEPQDTAPASSDDWSSSFESPSVTESSSSSSDWNSGWSAPSETSSYSSDSSSSSSWSSSSDSSSSYSSSSDSGSSSSYDSGSSFSGGSDW